MKNKMKFHKIEGHGDMVHFLLALETIFPYSIKPKI